MNSEESKFPDPTPPVNQASFSLATLLLVMTIAAVCAGVFAQWPGVGIGLAVLSVPALVRTVGIQRRRKEAQGRAGVGEKILTFLASLAVVTVIAVASCAAFCAACYSVALTISEAGLARSLESLFQWSMAIGLPLGLIAAGLVALALYRLLWRKRGR